MVRPQASKSNKDLVLLFADLTTIPTENHMDWIARTGPVSVFAAFTQCCASCVRVHKQGPSDGITELESNKVLEDAAGFKRVRSRRAKPVVPPELGGTQSDGPGYYFSNRRWRNPNDPADIARMRERWEVIVRDHRHVSIGCTFERMLEVVQRCRNLWAIKNPISNKSRNRATAQPHLSGNKRRQTDGTAEREEGWADGDEGMNAMNGDDAAEMSALEQLSDYAVKTAMKEEEAMAGPPPAGKQQRSVGAGRAMGAMRVGAGQLDDDDDDAKNSLSFVLN